MLCGRGKKKNHLSIHILQSGEKKFCSVPPQLSLNACSEVHVSIIHCRSNRANGHASALYRLFTTEIYTANDACKLFCSVNCTSSDGCYNARNDLSHGQIGIYLLNIQKVQYQRSVAVKNISIMILEYNVFLKITQNLSFHYL